MKYLAIINENNTDTRGREHGRTIEADSLDAATREARQIAHKHFGKQATIKSVEERKQP